jgi:flagellar biogenesis protein FliO
MGPDVPFSLLPFLPFIVLVTIVGLAIWLVRRLLRRFRNRP